MERSLIDELRGADDATLGAVLGQLGMEDAAKLRFLWSAASRPAQRAPTGDWRIWLVMAGRGFGKTRAGAEWVRGIAERDGRARIALVAASQDEARKLMVEGDSGLLSIAPPWNRPIWSPALRRLVWRSGAQATCYGAGDPEALRGPQHSHAWADEIGKWPDAVPLWDNLMMGLRLGDAPQLVATTTPRPTPLIRRLVTEAQAEGSDVRISTGRSVDNGSNLAPGFLDAMQARYGGTHLGRQELDGELIEEAQGALWSRALIEGRRVAQVPDIRRVVIGVDPPAGVEGDACGIVAVALGSDGHGYVLADDSVRGMGPEGWAQRVVASARAHGADRVVAEGNNGGAMVESVLRAADAALPVRMVHASRGKVARAEPVAALYTAGRVFHRGAFPALEDELCGLLAGGSYVGPGRSPDRADALVWALTELMLGALVEPRIRTL